MTEREARLRLAHRGWRKLGSLRARPIELERRHLIRRLARDELTSPAAMADLVARLGLNDEGLDEFPAELRPYCGEGLLIWQYPNQFGPYLAALAGLGIRSYLEVGVRHGGSFVATVEYLDRFRRLDFAVGVDVIPAPALADYHEVNPRARGATVDTGSPAFAELLAGLAHVDLVFIDSFHDEAQVRREFEQVRERAGAVAFHDVASDEYPGVGRVWREVAASPEYRCREFTDQYATVPGSHMGIGLAVRADRRPAGGE